MSQVTAQRSRSKIARRIVNTNLQAGRSLLRPKAKEMKERGIDVIDMSGYVVERPYGEFASPPDYVKNAVKNAVDNGWPEPSPRGIASLRRLIAEVEGKKTSSDVDAEKEVVVTGGGSMQALYNTIQATVNPGDEVIMFTPGLPYDEIVGLAEGVPVKVDLRMDEGYRFDASRVQAAISERTRLLIVNTPHNPSGHVLTRAELEGLAEVARRNDLTVISDDVLWNWVYDDNKYVSIASLPGMRERTVIVNSLTKSGLFDWRVGWAVGPTPIVDRLEKLMFWQNQFCAPMNQVASEAHLSRLGEWLAPIIKEQQRKRDYLHLQLVKMGLPCFKPEGAIMTFPSTAGYNADAIELASYILENGHVFVSPGVAYMRNGHLRVGYGNSMERLKEGLDRMARALDGYKRKN